MTDKIATSPRPDASKTHKYRPSRIWSLGGAGFSSRFFWISPADAAALSLALRALTVGKVFSGVAKNSVHEPTRASVRPARSIFLYFEDQSWPALSTTIPLCCNYCRSIARLPVRVFPEVYSLYCDRVTTYTPQNYFGFLA